MAEVPNPAPHVPTPGAQHLKKIPKWAWVAGGAGGVGLLILVEHKRAADTAAETDAINAPGDTTDATAGDAAMTADSMVASPYGDPYAATGTSYPLPRGEAPIVIGDPPEPADFVAPDAGGSEQLPPTTLNIQVGPIQDQSPRTGGGAAKGRKHSSKKPDKAHHGAANHKKHHTNRNGQKPGHHGTTKNSGHGVKHHPKHEPPKPVHHPPPKPVVKKQHKQQHR